MTDDAFIFLAVLIGMLFVTLISTLIFSAVSKLLAVPLCFLITACS